MQKYKNRKKTAGDLSDRQPLTATESYIEVDGRREKISAVIDKLIRPVLRNKKVPYANPNNTPSLFFNVINKDNDTLIDGSSFSYYNLNNNHYRFQSMISMSIIIPFFDQEVDKKNVAKECTDLTYNSMKQKIQDIIDKYQYRERKALIMTATTDHGSKFMFLHYSHMIYAEISMISYKAKYHEIKLNVYYVSPQKWMQFYRYDMRSYNQDLLWLRVHDYDYNKLKYNTYQRSAERSVEKSSKYSMQSLPVELIEMTFSHIDDLLISHEDLREILNSYKRV